MAQGAHSNGDGGQGEALDRVQKLVEEMEQACIPTGQTATRVRLQNRVVERSIIGQQYALMDGLESLHIRTQLAIPSRYEFTDNINPFVSVSQQTNTSNNTSDGTAPVTPSPNRNNAPRRSRQPDAPLNANASATESHTDAVDRASAAIASNLSRSLRSTRRAAASGVPPVQNLQTGAQFRHEGALAHFGNYLDPVASMITRTVDHHEIESMTRLHSLLTRQFDRSIDRNNEQPLANTYTRIRNQYEHRAQARFVQISDMLQTSAVQRLRSAQETEQQMPSSLSMADTNANTPPTNHAGGSDDVSTTSDELSLHGLSFRGPRHRKEVEDRERLERQMDGQRRTRKEDDE